MPLRPVFAATWITLLFACSTTLLAQMQPHARLDGEMLPIVSCSSERLTVLKAGSRRTTGDMNYEIRPGSTFGEGRVKITDVVADLDVLGAAAAKERMNPSAIRFRYKAKIVSENTMGDCYALLSFVTQGSVGTQLVPVGRLTAGKPKTVSLELVIQVDSVGSLHVFSNAMELRSNEHPDSYDVIQYYAALVKSVRGISAATLLKSEEFYEHKLSRDGQFLALLRQRDGSKVLIVYNLETMKLVCETRVAEMDDVVSGLTWVSDHEVAFVAEDDYEDRASEFKLYLLDMVTGKSKPLLNHVVQIIHSLPEEPEVLVLLQARGGHGVWTEKYNVHTGKTTNLESLESGNFLFDRNGESRVHVRLDGDGVFFSFRPTPGANWRDLDDAVKQPGLRFNVRGPQLLDRVVDVHSVGPDGDTLYVSTRFGGTDRFELAAFSMSQGVIVRTIAKHPKYDLTTSDGGMTRLLFAKTSPQLLGIIYEGQKPQVVWLDPVYAAAQKTMDATFPDRVNLPIDWSESGDTFIYFSGNDQDPGTFYVLKPAKSRLIPLLDLGERLKDRSLAKTEAIEFIARDGAKIPAYVTRPPVTTGELPPMIVYVHGGPMARDSWHFDANNQFFASRGYVVLQVNYRGSSGYGAAFQNAGLRARLDTVVVDDIADGAKYLIERKEVDPRRVAVMGGSFGGWATYMSLIKYPDIYRTGIAIAAVSNWRKALRDNRWTFDNKFAYTFWRALLNRENFAADEKFIDPYLRAAEIKQPVFIIHGEGDRVVHPTEAKIMLEALKKTNANVEARSFPNATHTYWSFADRIVLLNESANFLDRHLSPQKASAVVGATP